MSVYEKQTRENRRPPGLVDGSPQVRVGKSFPELTHKIELITLIFKKIMLFTLNCIFVSVNAKITA